MAFAVAKKDVAIGKGWTLVQEVFTGASHLREKCFLHVGHSYGRSRVSERVVSLMKKLETMMGVRLLSCLFTCSNFVKVRSHILHCFNAMAGYVDTIVGGF
jgi:hypothetical protein